MNASRQAIQVLQKALNSIAADWHLQGRCVFSVEDGEYSLRYANNAEVVTTDGKVLRVYLAPAAMRTAHFDAAPEIAMDTEMMESVLLDAYIATIMPFVETFHRRRVSAVVNFIVLPASQPAEEVDRPQAYNETTEDFASGGI